VRIPAHGLLAALLLVGSEAGAQAVANPPLAITHVTVVDVAGGHPLSDVTVSVANGRIVGIAPSGTSRVPPGTTAVDGAGKYLIPGLWDMHVHITEPPASDGDSAAEVYRWRAYFFPLLVANGVLGVRDMAGDIDTLTRWRTDIDSGTTLGPRLVFTGFKLGPALPVVPGAPAPIQTADQARTAVRLLKQHGADFVKVDLGVQVANLYPVVAEESRKQGLSFVGHVPLNLNPGDAAALGQRSIEHLMQVPLACSSEESGLRRRLMALSDHATWWDRIVGSGLWYHDLPHQYAVSQRVAETYDTAKAQALFARFVQLGTWQVPTLFMERDRAFHLPGDGPELEQRFGLAQKMKRSKRPSTPENTPHSEAFYRREEAIVGEMNKAGVRILAGTDMPTAHAIPGYSLHEELTLLVESGMTPLDALRAATKAPADFLGLADSMGTIETGKVADLVLLDADPLADIHNTLRIEAVVVRGRLLDRAALDHLLTQEEADVRDWNARLRKQ
jgi:imidazolonepropionase-like amidohydrolase